MADLSLIGLPSCIKMQHCESVCVSVLPLFFPHFVLNVLRNCQRFLSNAIAIHGSSVPVNPDDFNHNVSLAQKSIHTTIESIRKLKFIAVRFFRTCLIETVSHSWLDEFRFGKNSTGRENCASAFLFIAIRFSPYFKCVKCFFRCAYSLCSLTCTILC